MVLSKGRHPVFEDHASSAPPPLPRCSGKGRSTESNSTTTERSHHGVVPLIKWKGARAGVAPQDGGPGRSDGSPQVRRGTSMAACGSRIESPHWGCATPLERSFPLHSILSTLKSGPRGACAGRVLGRLGRRSGVLERLSESSREALPFTGGRAAPTDLRRESARRWR